MKAIDWKRQDWDEVDTRESTRERKIKEHTYDNRGHKSYAKS